MFLCPDVLTPTNSEEFIFHFATLAPSLNILREINRVILSPFHNKLRMEGTLC